MKYVIHHQGTETKPMEIKEILVKLDSRELDWTDYVYDEQKKDWIVLLEHSEFEKHFQNWKPAHTTTPQEVPQDHGWFVLRDDNRYGPFTHLEVIKMLQSKKLREFDYVWNRPLMTSWERISDVPDFKPEKIKSLKEDAGPDMEEIFFRRRHARARYGASILLHNNKEVWRGHSMEVGAGGAGLVIESDEVQVGQNLFLHFKAGDGVPPFNAVCEIVSKQKLKGNEYRYGVKFTSISQTVQRAIKKYTDQAA